MSKLIDVFVIDNYHGIKTETKCKRISFSFTEYLFII